MEVYCVKEKRFTPNVTGSEKITTTKNNKRMLKVKCASCGITKTRFISGVSATELLPTPQNAQEGGNLFDFLKHFNPKETYDAVKRNKVPWVVDFDKGFSLLKDAFKPNPVSTKTAKEQMARYKRDYAKYKRAGGSKSWHNWLKDKGLIRKPTF